MKLQEATGNLCDSDLACLSQVEMPACMKCNIKYLSSTGHITAIRTLL